MTPAFRIIANDADITTAIEQRLLSLRINDHSGEKSDSVELVLDDRDGVISLPSTGADLQISIGYEGRGPLSDMGLWVVDEIELSSPPAMLTIRAKSANISKSKSTKKGIENALKASKTRPWDGVSIDDIVSTIADESGYTSRVGSDFASIQIGHIDQMSESNMHFLTRLARQYGAVSKPAGGFLLFVKRGEAASASGKPMTPIELSPDQCTSLRIVLSDREDYQTIIAHYHDHDTAKRETVQSGNNAGATKTLPRTYANKAEAEAAVKSKQQRLDEDIAKGSIQMPGDPTIIAETPIMLSGFRNGADGNWICESVMHEISNSGYITQIEITKNSLQTF